MSPVACAASLGVFETIEQDGLVQRAREVGELLGTSLRALAAKYPIIAEVRGRGAMQAIELVQPGSLEPNTEAMTKVINFCAKKGVLLLSAGTYSNVIRFLPPLVITDELLKDALNVLEEGLASL